MDQLAQEDPGLYGGLNSDAIRYFQTLTTTAASSGGSLLLLHIDEMAAVVCVLVGCGVFNLDPEEEEIYEIASPDIEHSTVRRSALALLETMDDIGQCHPEHILTCVEPDISEPNDLDIDEVDRRFDAALAARLKPEKARTPR